MSTLYGLEDGNYPDLYGDAIDAFIRIYKTVLTLIAIRLTLSALI